MLSILSITRKRGHVVRMVGRNVCGYSIGSHLGWILSLKFNPSPFLYQTTSHYPTTRPNYQYEKDSSILCYNQDYLYCCYNQQVISSNWIKMSGLCFVKDAWSSIFYHKKLGFMECSLNMWYLTHKYCSSVELVSLKAGYV